MPDFLNQTSRTKPHILFYTPKWRGCNPQNVFERDWDRIRVLDRLEIATYEKIYYDELYYQNSILADGVLIQKCRETHPDLVFLLWAYHHIPDQNPNPRLETLDLIRRWMHIPVVLEQGDTSMPICMRQTELLLPFVDLVVTYDSGSAYLEVTQHPEKYLHFPAPFDPLIFYDAKLNRDIDISLPGNFQNRPKRLAAIAALQAKGINLHHTGGTPDKWATIEEYARLLMRSKIVVNDAHNGFTPVFNGRTIESTLSGAMLLEYESPETVRWFKPMVEYIPYTDEVDLVEKARYYIEHHQERVEIAARGHKKANDTFTGSQFYNTIFERLGLKPPKEIPGKSSEQLNNKGSSEGIRQIQSVHDVITAQPTYKNVAKVFAYNPETCFGLENYPVYPVLEKILSEKRPRSICEVGCGMGAVTRFFATFPFVKQVIGINQWITPKINDQQTDLNLANASDNSYRQFLANCTHTELAYKIYPVSCETNGDFDFNKVQDIKFDLIFINGDGSTVDMQKQIRRWCSCLTPNGLLCGNHWSRRSEANNIPLAVARIAEEKNWHIYYHGNLWVILPGSEVLKMSDFLKKTDLHELKGDKETADRTVLDINTAIALQDWNTVRKKLLDLSNLEMAQGNFKSAESILLPNQTELLKKQGVSLYKIGDIHNAEKAFHLAGHHQMDVLISLGKICYETKRYQEAIFYLMQAVQLEPKNTEPWLGLAQIAKHLGENQASEAFNLQALNRG